jgi:N6-L-threonylcarbamoyladenine synthase
MAYAMGPGLGPCLRVGAVIARALATHYKKPLVPVNHAIGHIELGCLLTGAADPLVLLVTGGHTLITAFQEGRWRIFGETLDLTIGQLLDQLGREFGFASPCGAKIEELAARTEQFVSLPYVVKGQDVSFSGILSAAKRELRRGGSREVLAYSVQEVAFALLAEVTERAIAFTEKRELMVVGGVAANRRLQHMLRQVADRHGSVYYGVPAAYSGDCGAQIAWAGLLAATAGVAVPVERSTVRQAWRLDQVEIPWRS